MLHGAARSARTMHSRKESSGDLELKIAVKSCGCLAESAASSLAVLLGTTALPVVLAGEPLARSVMRKAHREDHRRGPRDAAARSKKVNLDSIGD